ncbi:MAG: peptidylprolyl isomerase [Kofleriaceae bacterium]|nr:peptidylprolyl isomerase [Kofleriaceae bacterium]
MVLARAFAVAMLISCGGSSELTTDAARLVDAGELYLPSGTTLTPYLSTEAQHSFSAAGTATEAGKDYLAVIETPVGRIVVDLYEEQTPITVNSFVWLALHHFYDGIAFHRVISGFVAQGGDPNTLEADRSTWGEGGPGYEFGLEIVPELTYDGAGVVAMARAAAPNTNGSQFFITFAPQHSLDGDYTIFGRVTEGLDVLPLLVRGEPPANPTRMQRVHIVERAR